MIVEIDDAGTGSIVGGVVIGAKKGDRYAYLVIPVIVFQEEEMYKELKNIVVKYVLELLENLEFEREQDEVLLCQGNIFSSAEAKLKELNIRVMLGKIDSSLQDYVETAFDLHLTTIGVPRDLVKRLRDYRDYTLELIKWVVVNLPEREKYVKKLYPIWEKKWKKSTIVREEIRVRRNRYCINCGKDIKKGEKAHLIKISTPNGKYTAYSHISCENR